MKRQGFTTCRRLIPLSWLLLLLVARVLGAQGPSAANVAAYEAYRATLETRLERQHHSVDGFVVLPASSRSGDERRLRQGELVVERIPTTTVGDLNGAILHHWRGTAFVLEGRAADFEELLRDVDAYPRHFAPQVVRAKANAQGSDRMETSMRVRQRHVITVVMDTTYDVTFGKLDGQHRYSTSLSSRIAEVESAGTSAERVMSPQEEHGFLWRQNTYWSYEERDGGLYLQIESVSLTRAIPNGLGWMMQPYVESIPRESLEFTLRSACNGVRR